MTEHPTATWTAQQIVDAFPENTAPAYLLRDRDTVYGDSFRRRVQGLGIREVLTAPRSPWRNPFAERLIGSIRRECLDHPLVLSDPCDRWFKQRPPAGGALRAWRATLRGQQRHEYCTCALLNYGE